MASAKITVVCGLKVGVGCQDRLCMNSDADETLASQLYKNLGKEGKGYLTVV